MNDQGFTRKLLLRKKAILLARKDLIAFAQFMSPVPDDRDDVTISLYRPSRHHRVLGAALEEVEKGAYKRLQITLPPRHGKTRLASHMFAAWFIGRNPEKSIIVATYSEKFAWDHGRAVRDLMDGPLYNQVFPKARLKAGSASVDRLETTAGGVIFFLGRGSGATGRGADVILLDDPTKDRKEADSPTIREQLWSWYAQVLQTRLMTKAGAIVIIQCLTGDTAISMAGGGSKRLDEVASGDRVVSWDGSRIVGSEVAAVIDNGYDQTYLLRTNRTEIRANARHPFLVLSDEGLRWIRIRDLQPGMRIVRHGTEPIKASFALRTAVSDRPNAEDCAAVTMPRRNGLPGRAHFPARLRSAWRRAVNGVTALTARILTGCSPSRTAFAPYALPMAAPAGPSIGSQISFPTITTKLGNYAAFYATTATGSPDELEIPKSWNAPSITSEPVTDIVESVTPFGVEKVYDLTVSTTHNFVANGLWTHNTRWHEDDLIGRLTDPQNPCYSLAEAKKWRVIDMPALARKDDVLGRKEGEPLWPERFDEDYLDSIRQTDIRGFQALYQGRPTPEEGSFFKAVNLRTYPRVDRMPAKDRLRFYCASDHAVSLEQGRDKTCLMCVGVDEHDQMWVQPDCFWRQADTNTVVEVMIAMMEKYQPLFWWAGKDHISKSIGPFLRKRMMEKRVFCSIAEFPPVGDKLTRAQSIQGRMAMMKVLFPSFVHWWAEAHDQLLKFPQGAHDDFVDTLALFGIGLQQQRGQTFKKKAKEVPKEMTYGWVIESAKKERDRENRSTGGW